MRKLLYNNEAALTKMNGHQYLVGMWTDVTRRLHSLCGCYRMAIFAVIGLKHGTKTKAISYIRLQMSCQQNEKLYKECVSPHYHVDPHTVVNDISLRLVYYNFSFRELDPTEVPITYSWSHILSY